MQYTCWDLIINTFTHVTLVMCPSHVATHVHSGVSIGKHMYMITLFTSSRVSMHW